MPLTSGTRLGPYEIVAPIGAGGMGEVYRARDTKLNRDVALKILPDAFASDPDRLARFTREAQTLASLNHPNIAQIHGFEDAGATHALVMELVEGRDLSEVILSSEAGPSGPADAPGLKTRPPFGVSRGIPIEDALAIARQIADALEAAHDAGIIHRDLKPANVKVRDDGTVKVLDFGLAKAMDSHVGRGFSRAEHAAAEATPYVPSESPTMLSPAMTELGMILGTASYMSPEQAKGRVVDKRADIWAFGVVLYEMLTGRALFDGDSVAETIGLVATRDPDWTALPASTPAGVRRLLARCLTRDPKHRLRDIGEARIALATPDDPPVAQAAVSPVVARRERAVWVGVVLAGIAVAAVATWFLKPAPAIAPGVVTRFNSLLPAGQAFTGGTSRGVVAISPDGTKVAYIANRQLYLRGMNQIEAQPIRGSDEDPYELTFSPDGQWIAYFADITGPRSVLKKIAIAGGTPVTLCPTPLQPSRLSWHGNTIVFAQYERDTALNAIQTVADGGGPPQSILSLDGSKERVLDAQLLDDGAHVLMAVAQRSGTDAAAVDIVVQPLKGGERKVLVKGAADARLLRSGHLVYMREGTVLAVSIDSKRFELTGVEAPVVEGLARGPQFDVADNGTLVFVPGVRDDSPRRTLVWVDRQGHESPIATQVRAYQHLRLSPDGKQIAVEIRDEEHDIWIWDLASEALTRLTFGPSWEGYPVWARDSRRVFYRLQDGTGAGIVRRAADGTGSPEQLLKGAEDAAPVSLSLDSKHLVYRGATAKTNRDLMLLPLDPVGPPKPLIQNEFGEDNGQVSPDGRWIAYESNESGQQREVFVRPFPAVDTGKVKVSSGGGFLPLWSRDGRELSYVTRVADTPTLVGVAVPVQAATGSSFIYGKREVLFPMTPYVVGVTLAHDISLDGRRFLMVKTMASVVPPSITVVSHWFDELRARVK